MNRTSLSLCLTSLILSCALPALAAGAGQAVRYETQLAKASAPQTASSPHARRIARVDQRLSQRLSAAAGVSAGRPASPDARLGFSLFPDVSFEAEPLSYVERADGTATWTGRVVGRDDAQVVLSVYDGHVHGRIDLGTDQFVLEGPLQGKALVTQIDPGSFAGKQRHEDALSLSRARPAAAANRTDTAADGQTLANGSVDLLFVYTDRVNWLHHGKLGGPPSPELVAAMQSLVDDANASFAAAQAGGSLNIVGRVRAESFHEPVPANPTFDIWSDTLGQMHASVAPFADLDSLRQTYNADVIVLLVDGARMPATCGVASIPPDQNSANWRDSVVIVNVRCAIGDRTFIHELGHVFGGHHEGEAPPNALPPLNHAQGFINSSAPFRTIMAVGPLGSSVCTTALCARINRWSSPNSYYNGYILGASNTNMKAAVTAMFPTVAAYSDMTP